MIKLINNELIKIKKTKLLFSQFIILFFLVFIKKVSNYDIDVIAFKMIPFIGIITTILFGGIISNEIDNGTFRFYLTKPYKRWKVYLSKIIVIYLYITITLFMIVLLVLLFKNDFEVYKFIKYSIPIYFIGSFCFYLSTKYKSQSFIVGVSVFTLTFSLIIAQLLFGIKFNIVEYTFLPYLDFSLFDDKVQLYNLNKELNVNLSLNRGIIIDSISIVLMYLLGNYKFNKKDIKN